MSISGQAVIIVQRPTNYFFGGSRSFIVWIDGRRAGKVKRGAVGDVRATAGVADANWRLHWLILTFIYIAIFGGYVLATSAFVRDYWAVWTLGSSGTESLEVSPVPNKRFE